MRDSKRRPLILEELEKVWKENPDYRLGQLITVFSKPSTPHPTTFYIEDDKILKAIKSFGNKTEQNSTEAYWNKYPELIRIELDDLTSSLIEKFIKIIKTENKKIVITAKELLKLNGAPVDDENWFSKQEQRVKKIERILNELKNKNLIEEIQIGYGIKE
jgi:hypothetical protein